MEMRKCKEMGEEVKEKVAVVKTQQLIPQNWTLPANLRVNQKFSHFSASYETQGSVPCSQKHVIASYAHVYISCSNPI
jgi:hypothetical protein